MAAPVKSVNFDAITVADKLKAVAGSALLILLMAQAIDLGTALNVVVGVGASFLLALGVKPLGPAK